MKLAIAIASTLFALAGCGDSSIDKVKNYYIDSDRTTTIDSALSHRKLCSEIKWENFKDEVGRQLVQYSCRFTDGKDYNREGRENFLKDRARAAQEFTQTTRDRLLQVQAELAADFPDIRARLDSINASLENYSAGEVPKSATLQDLEDALTTLDAFQGEFDRNRALELYRTKVLQRYGYGEGGVERNLEFMSLLPADKAEKYMANEIEPVLRRIHRDIRGARNYIVQQIELEVRQSKVTSEENYRRLNNRRDELLTSLESYRDEYKERQVSYGKLISEAVVEKKEEETRREADERYPRFVEVNECFLWVLNDSDVPILTSGKLQGQLDGGVFSELAVYNKPEGFLFLAANSKALGMAEYIEDMREAAIFFMMAR